METLAEITTQHAKILRDARGFIAKQVQSLKAAAEVALSGETSPQGLVSMTKVIVELERLVHGASTENLSVRDEVQAISEGRPQRDLSRLTVEELHELKRLDRKSRGLE